MCICAKANVSNSKWWNTDMGYLFRVKLEVDHVFFFVFFYLFWIVTILNLYFFGKIIVIFCKGASNQRSRNLGKWRGGVTLDNNFATKQDGSIQCCFGPVLGMTKATLVVNGVMQCWSKLRTCICKASSLVFILSIIPNTILLSNVQDSLGPILEISDQLGQMTQCWVLWYECWGHL